MNRESFNEGPLAAHEPPSIHDRQAAAHAHKLNPFPWYAQMRAHSPVAYDAQNHIWNVFRYTDVQQVLSDYAAFSSEFGHGEAAGPLSESLISADPPRHRQLRALVTQAFTPRAVAALEPRITAIVDELLDTVAARGSMDLISDVAYPLPVIVISELLGIPADERDQFKRWSDAVISGGGHPHSSTMRDMSAYFMAKFVQRRAEPRDDLISQLLEAQIEGRHLTDRELLGFCILLLVAGNETTTNLLGNAALCFDEQPDAWDRLRAERTLLPNAIEEVLRYRSPVQAMFRTCKQDTAIDEHPIKPRQPVIAWIGSANRDETQFPNADRFDITRANNRHIAFGHGIHFCLGAPLARLEARIALNAMLDRFATLRRRDQQPLQPIQSMIVYGVHHLPVVFTPAP